MRAAAIRALGGADQIQLIELPIPEPNADEVLIRVRAAGVGLWDAKVRQHNMAGNEAPRFPLVLGWECAGVVERTGAGVRQLAPGDEVFAYAFRRGAYAEFVLCPETAAAPKPRSLSFEQAAAVPISGITAHQVIVEDLNVRAGETVLITAGAGGTGVFAIQLAAARGARVITTASEQNFDFLRDLGAGETVDYHRDDWPEAIRVGSGGGVDALLECIGGENFDCSLRAVRGGGRAVSIVGPPSPGAPDNVDVKAIFGRPDAGRLRELARLIDAGELRVVVQEALPLAEAARAHQLVEAGHVRGKLVLVVGRPTEDEMAGPVICDQRCVS